MPAPPQKTREQLIAERHITYARWWTRDVARLTGFDEAFVTRNAEKFGGVRPFGSKSWRFIPAVVYAKAVEEKCLIPVDEGAACA